MPVDSLQHIDQVGVGVHALTSVGWGQEAGELDNEDIVTLTEAGLSPTAIVAVIESSATDFDISVAQLAALAGAVAR